MCDICSSPDKTYKVEIEGTILNVCDRCSSFGKVLAKVKPEMAEKKKKKLEKAAALEAEIKAKKETETIQIITPNYPVLIKNARERMGLKQEELAKKIAEKESLIHKMESGSMVPGIPLARKLEKFLRISIVENIEMEPEGGASDKKKISDGLTIGDMIRIK